MTSRRKFVRNSSIVLGTTMIPGVLRARAGTVAPSDQVRVGVIGCNGMGFQNLLSALKIPEVECGALCDVDASVLNRRANEVEQRTGTRPNLYPDFRELLDDDGIDAVIIGTPDHWHCLIMAMACEAGKDVYVEKPLANSIGECGLMIAAAERHGTVVQAGQWQRSGSHWSDAAAYVQSGEIGRIRLVKAWAYQGWMKAIPVKPDEPVPDGVDYDMWLGPAPDAPYHIDRCLYRFRFLLDYSGGQVTNTGAHSNDIVQWALGLDGTGPVEFEDLGAKWPPVGHLYTTAMKTAFRARHANGVELVCRTQDPGFGARFEGTDGWIQYTYNKIQASSEEILKSEIGPDELRLPVSKNHYRNWLDCVKSRQEPIEPVEVGHSTASICHCGNIAMRLGRKVQWDPKTETFVDDKEANEMLRRPYRGQWSIENSRVHLVPRVQQQGVTR